MPDNKILERKKRLVAIRVDRLTHKTDVYFMPIGYNGTTFAKADDIFMDAITVSGMIHPVRFISACNDHDLQVYPGTYYDIAAEWIKSKYKHTSVLSHEFIVNMWYEATRAVGDYPEADDFPSEADLAKAFDEYIR